MSLINTISSVGSSSTFSDNILQYSSANNELVPFYATFKGSTVTNSIDKYLLYNKVAVGGNSYNYLDTKYTQVLYSILQRTGIRFVRTARNLDKQYVVTKGFLAFKSGDNFIPMFILCIKSKELYNVTLQNLDVSKFCILVNNNMIVPEHSIMYRNMKKSYIDPLIAEGVDIIYTNNIDKWCYNKIPHIPAFKTINGMQEHLKTINDNIFNFKTVNQEQYADLPF